MLPLKEKDKPIVQKLLSAGCCARCILRFCCIRVQATYRRPQQDTLEELQTFIHSAENSQSHDAAAPETSGENNQSHDAAAPETSGENNQSHDAAAPETSGENNQSHDAAAAAPAVTEAPQEPPSKRAKLEPSGTNAAEKGLVLDKDDIIPLKEAFKWIMQGLVSKELGGAVVVTKSALEVGVEFTHKETDADCHFLATVCPDCFKPAKNKQPSSCCSPQGVQCLHLSVFVAGRYNKFCRSLPQTPWLIDGERRMESSVEELIAAPVLSTFRAEGRPFAMELLNPHRSRLSRMEMKQLQQNPGTENDTFDLRPSEVKGDLFLSPVCCSLTSDHDDSYIKEFVHGDFGRTKPNLCELLRTDADILELDVEVTRPGVVLWTWTGLLPYQSERRPSSRTVHPVERCCSVEQRVCGSVCFGSID
ncbi:hypothetical protein F2P81_009753 [Scophthalmus maximus]|uniref:tRNA pseudouridine(55) synthase n=1 Tax=Scophthalmus maximus TaxID=52904 RepID=A0A6A4SW29_SCOMX|nr:hypothetical protein F2P81_009753 [Scophthalmus maximus]